jgi:hypothetical protein
LFLPFAKLAQISHFVMVAVLKNSQHADNDVPQRLSPGGMPRRNGRLVARDAAESDYVPA